MTKLRVGIVADLHYDLFQNISMLREDMLTNRADEIDMVFKQVMDEVVSSGIKHLFILGDALHKRNIRPDAVTGLLYRRLKYGKEKGIQIYLLVGNHDQAHVAGDVHAFETFGEVVTVIDKSRVISLEGFDFYMLPYEEYKGTAKSIEILLKNNKNPNRLLMAHAGICGANLSGFDHASREPLTVQDIQLDKFLHGYFGHYHLPQMVGTNGMYIGSPCQHSLVDRIADRGWVEVSMELDKVWKAVNTFHVIESPTFVEVSVDKYHKESFVGKHYVKVTGCSRKEVIELQNDANVFSTTGERVEQVVDETKTIQPELNWSEMIDKYIQITEPNIRRHRNLKKMGRGFIDGGAS